MQSAEPAAHANPKASVDHELRDASGVLVAIHERLVEPDGTKHFIWRQPDGAMGLGGMRVADLPLYGIDRLDGMAAVVVLVEGEKCADALQRVGIAAVGTVTGASATPSARVLAELTGRRVILWPDADHIGRKHMVSIAERLAGIASAVLIVEPPEGAPAGWDAADAMAEDRDVAAILAGSQPYELVRRPNGQPEFQPIRDSVGTLMERTGQELLEGPD